MTTPLHSKLPASRARTPQPVGPRLARCLLGSLHSPSLRILNSLTHTGSSPLQYLSHTPDPLSHTTDPELSHTPDPDPLLSSLSLSLSPFLVSTPCRLAGTRRSSSLRTAPPSSVVTAPSLLMPPSRRHGRRCRCAAGTARERGRATGHCEQFATPWVRRGRRRAWVRSRS